MPWYFLQLPLFKKEADECDNQVERRIYLLKNIETLSRLPWAAQSAVFKKLESIADVGAMSRAERLKYDEALKKYRDTISVLEGARMEGREEGYKEGWEIGYKEGLEIGYKEGLELGYKEGLELGHKEDTIANARKMKAYGLAWDMIAEITGLTIDEVKDLE